MIIYTGLDGLDILFGPALSFCPFSAPSLRAHEIILLLAFPKFVKPNKKALRVRVTSTNLRLSRAAKVSASPRVSNGPGSTAVEQFIPGYLFRQTWRQRAPRVHTGGSCCSSLRPRPRRPGWRAPNRCSRSRTGCWSATASTQPMTSPSFLRIPGTPLLNTRWKLTTRRVGAASMSVD